MTTWAGLRYAWPQKVLERWSTYLTEWQPVCVPCHTWHHAAHFGLYQLRAKNPVFHFVCFCEQLWWGPRKVCRGMRVCPAQREMCLQTCAALTAQSYPVSCHCTKQCCHAPQTAHSLDSHYSISACLTIFSRFYSICTMQGLLSHRAPHFLNPRPITPNSALNTPLACYQ